MLVYRRADGMRNFHRSVAEHDKFPSFKNLYPGSIAKPIEGLRVHSVVFRSGNVDYDTRDGG